MGKRETICEYTIKDGVLEGVIRTLAGQAIRGVTWCERRTGLECDNLEYEWVNREEGLLRVRTDFLSEAFAIRTWRLTLEMEDGSKRPVYHAQEAEESECGKMASLEKADVSAAKHIHLIPAIDKDGAFAIRKWRTKSELVRTKPVYVRSVRRFGTTLEMELDRRFTKEVYEAEVFLWCKSNKRLVRVPVSAKGVNEGSVSFCLRRFIEANGDVMQKLWEAYLVMNMGGSYYFSRIEGQENRKWEKKRMAADKKGEAFHMPKRPKKMEEEGRYFGGVAYVPREEGGYAIELDEPERTECVGVPYFTEDMQFGFRFLYRRYLYANQLRERLEDVSIRRGVCRITTVSLHEDFRYHGMALRYREPGDGTGESEYGDREVFFRLVSGKLTKEGYRQIWKLDLKRVEFQQYYWDIFLIGEKDGYDYEVRPINLEGKRLHKKLYKGYGNVHLDEKDRIVFPYVTENENIVLFCRQRHRYDAYWYALKEKLAIFWYGCFRRHYDEKKAILLYEKHCMMAQDNSYAMFTYFMEGGVKEEVRKAAYYIIDKKQPDYRKLKRYGNKVLAFMGVRHMVYLQASRLFVSIDSKRHAFAWRARNGAIMDILQEKPFLFLQHGLVGLKRVDYIYKKGGINSASHIVVSSEREKGMVIKWFGYGEHEIIKAGMARWDDMQDRSGDARVLLFMPTWRNWLQEVCEEEFLASDYYRHYSELLACQELEDFLEANDLQLVYCMHPKFREFIGKFKPKSKRILLFGYETKPIIDLVQECRLLITDYSSVSWDFYYLKKPIIFYQFDYNKYMELQGSYYDMEKESFGARVFDKEGLLEELGRYCDNGFREREEHSVMRKECLPDASGSLRDKIYEVIERTYFGKPSKK